MDRKIASILAGLGSALLLPLAGSAAAADQWDSVGKALGKSGTLQGGIYKVSLPRSDLKVAVGGQTVKPALALGSWLAFKPIDGQAMVMGDLVLTEAEVPAVTKRLADGGIAITAIHNHLLHAVPMPIYVHFEGHGDPTQLATALHKALEASKTPLGEGGKAQTEKTDLDTAAIDRALGRHGEANGSVYQFNIERAKPVTEAGMEIPPSMGTAIAINLQSAGKGKAATTGDFVLTAEEVNPVIKELTDHGIEVTAVHSHMLEEEPRLFFLHFWGVNDTAALSNGLRAALDKVATKKE